MSENTTVHVCKTCGELVPLGCCTCGPRQRLGELKRENPWRELWAEWFDSRGEPWGDTEGDRHGNRWCFFCDNPDDHFPDCVYLKAKRLLDKEAR